MVFLKQLLIHVLQVSQLQLSLVNLLVLNAHTFYFLIRPTLQDLLSTNRLKSDMLEASLILITFQSLQSYPWSTRLRPNLIRFRVFSIILKFYSFLVIFRRVLGKVKIVRQQLYIVRWDLQFWSFAYQYWVILDFRCLSLHSVVTPLVWTVRITLINRFVIEILVSLKFLKSSFFRRLNKPLIVLSAKVISCLDSMMLCLNDSYWLIGV